ncbi:MAG TPA: type IV pilus assembly protein PilM, partial [Actinobacteria bacterium]|nr:type IV pilus assembly protein PilM [Actinomycetes bacterium]HEX21784.1 type IV pilus assembly protein PilM [Actinomycetota bacterium]
MGIFPFGRSATPIGLDIGTGHFRAAQITPGAATNTLANYAKIKVPVGSVVEGEIIDVETVSQSLTQLWKKSGLSGKDVTIGIASQKVIVRLIELPFMEPNELKGAIQFQAQDYIPIPINEAIIDAQIVNQFLGENDEKMIEVLLVAAQKDLINNTISAVEKAGLRPQVVDLSAFAIVRSLLDDTNTFLPEDDDTSVESATALINIGSGLTNIVVVEDGMPRFARVTPMAGDDLNRAISDALNVSFEVADELKRKVGLPK